MTLYEIDAEILALLETADEDTGEITAEAAEQLAALSMGRNDKCEQIALVYKNRLAEETAIKAEINALTERHKQAKKRTESVKSYLEHALQGHLLETARVAVKYRKSNSVVIDDESQIPHSYMRKTVKYDPDKTAIKEAVQHGIEVPGARIEERSNIQIK